MSSKHTAANAAAHEEHRVRFGDNLRGALIVLFGAVALVGISYGVMVAITSPDGWIAKAAGSAIRGENVQITSFGTSEPASNQQPF
jgi:hypothetical protein